MLNMNISEKIELLKSELNSLNKELERSRSGFETSQKFISIIGKSIDFSKLSDYETWMSSTKEYLSNELEFLRTQVEMIRKFSPQTADYLSGNITQYEESSRNLFKLSEEWYVKKIPFEQNATMFATTLLGFFNSYLKLHDMIKMCRDCIHDTLKRLE